MPKVFKKHKGRQMNHGDLLAKRVQLPRAQGWEGSGILEMSKEKVTSPVGLRTPLSKEGTLQAGRALPTAAPSSYSHAQATCGSHSSDGNGTGMEPMRTRGGS